MINIAAVDLPQGTEDLVLEVVRSGMLAQGPMVARFEAEFAAIVGVRHAVAVNNGTTALVAALQVLDLEPGDEVVTSPFTFVATLNAILEAGATAVFADIRDSDFCIDPDAAKAAIGPRTKVLMPVHLYGQCADMGPLTALAEEHRLCDLSRTPRRPTPRRSMTGGLVRSVWVLLVLRDEERHHR